MTHPTSSTRRGGADRCPRPPPAARVRMLSRRDKVVVVPACSASRCCSTWPSSGSRRSRTVAAVVHQVDRRRQPATEAARPTCRHPQPGCSTACRTTTRRPRTTPPFWPAVRHNVIWLVVFIVIATPLGHALRGAPRPQASSGTRIYQSLLFLPVMLSLALIGIIWELIYSPNYGLINTVIGRNGQQQPDRLARQPAPQPVGGAGRGDAGGRPAYVMVLYLAGLKAVDPSLREAAIVDGANAWQTFWRVDLPGDAPDQHRHPRGHRHRVAARVRPRLHHQQAASERPGAAVGRWSPRTSSARPSGSASARRSASCCW